MCNNPMTCANVGLAIGWIVANVSVLVWTSVTKPDPLTMLRVVRISCVTTGLAAAALACIGFSLGLITAPLIDVLAVAGCGFLVHLNLTFRRWALLGRNDSLSG